MIKSSLSMLFFAPGVFLLAVCIFIGLLLMVEKALTRAEAPGAVAETEGAVLSVASNPSPGQLVSDLSSSLELEEQVQAADKKKRAAG